MFKNKTILVTGGTGSFGKTFVNYFLHKFKNLKKIIVFSRDELKQYDMAQNLPFEFKNKIRFFLGDVRDKDRLNRALCEVDYVVHAAALKQVNTAEYNPMEFIKTNIIGAQNLIEICIDRKVKKLIALSTDKAASPINLYGATKLCSDKLFVSANNYSGNKVNFSVVRYGNVMGSRGSVVPLFLNLIKNKKPLTVTSPQMTRFNITLKQGVEMVIESLLNSVGGEIVVPKIPSYNIIDLVKAINPSGKYKITGLRAGEKIHEDLITQADSLNTFEGKKYFYIFPNSNEKKFLKFIKLKKLKKVAPNFQYNSGSNKNFLTVTELKRVISLNVKK
jgi:UDP-N-acetylglucosamine 4,6-dehydratase